MKLPKPESVDSLTALHANLGTITSGIICDGSGLFIIDLGKGWIQIA